MERIEICPQVIYSFKSEDQLTNDIKKLAEREEYVLNGGTYFSCDRRLNKKEEYKNLVHWIEDTCAEKIKQEYSYECEKFSVSQMWINKYGHKNDLIYHYHTNSYISGIFYLTESNASTVFFYQDQWSDLKKKHVEIDEVSREGLIVHKQPTIPGNLILFPSTLYHLVDEHLMKDVTRYTVSFNLFPSGQINNFSHLRGLNITVN